MKTLHNFSYLITQTDLDAGNANNLPVGSSILIIDSNNLLTGKEYKLNTVGQLPTEGSGGIKNNLAATTAPTTSNDSTQGYAVGSRWIDTTANESYVCTKATNPASWSQTTVGTIAEVAGLQTALNAKVDTTTNTSDMALKAPLASPTFTGTVGGVTKTMVGLGSADNTADTAKPVSTAQQTALNLKQATLVSGTNIKTVNGSSIVGSGDVPIAGATSIATQNSTTPIQGTGGTITTVNGGLETVHKFTASGTFVVPAGVTGVQALVVAGGGGGGYQQGGGGGAGGLKTSASLPVTAGASITVTVGAGGAGGTSGGAATNGTNSVFSTITATGGGAGGNVSSVGVNGGSGGGSGAGSTTVGAGVSGEGNNGGSGLGAAPSGGGGGGGASAVGTAKTSTPDDATNAAGGAGTVSTITGTSTPYAGGGGGGKYSLASGSTVAAAGGVGGGGAGALATVGTAGTANTGGGGGGGGQSATLYAGGDGGTGIVIVRYTHTYTQEPVIPIFADNTAASSLAVGSMYRTSTGMLNVRY